MRGTTNAQGLTWPDLTETIQRLQNNPPVGSLTTFAGFDWVVVHWDTATKCMYLMLKGIYTRTTWADSASEHVPYDDSKVKEELLNFERLMKLNIFSGPTFFDAYDLPLVKKNGSYAFIPTESEAKTFAFFQQKALPLNESVPTLFINAIVIDDENHEARIRWWLSQGETADDKCHYVSAYGLFTALDTVSDETDSNHQYGVLPFICMKMR